jgi:hypothetical protein
MMIHDMKTVLLRDLERLKQELHLYPNQETMWQIAPGTLNSAGNLALHLVGNLRHFIGNELGKSGYVRQRELEFSLKNVNLSELDELIAACSSEISAAFDAMDPKDLQKEFPKDVGGIKRDTSFVLLHLLGHFSYHLGQINYHRRTTQSTLSGD